MTIPATAPTPSPSTPVFVYGSLMSAKILYNIIGRPATLTPALLRTHMSAAALPHYRRHSVHGADFPAIVHTGLPTDSVRGFLVAGLTEPQKARIDRFEGALYTCEEVRVVPVDGGGEACGALVYVWAGDAAHLGVKEWSFEAFKRTRMYTRWGDEDEE